jgi:GNAT superfamily N-acetyltransferase
MSFRIRDIDLPKDETAALSFIDGSQRFEYAFEPDRRLDSSVAGEHFAVLMKRVAERDGRIFIADEDSRAVGWAVFYVEQNMLYVIEQQRTHGYIAELFVNEDARSLGVGRTLIASCEAESLRLGLRQIMIGVLAGNSRAAWIYARAGYSPYSSELRKYL